MTSQIQPKKYICESCSKEYCQKEFHRYEKDFCSLKCCQEYHLKVKQQDFEKQSDLPIPTFDGDSGGSFC